MPNIKDETSRPDGSAPWQFASIRFHPMFEEVASTRWPISKQQL
ncbi:MAG: hypothetical protein ACO3JG_02805 [Luteolibacter sp.]